ncbi:MAG: hypothetical protein RLZZ381_1782 [Cyanobacteriota bacterium]|jgi:alpha-ketoglutaric semialdehyde dehydrogenase
MDTTPLICHNYIDGNWISGQTIKESRNPADWREVVATFPSSDLNDVNLAVAAARRACKTWRIVPAPVRAELVHRIGEILLLKIT